MKASAKVSPGVRRISAGNGGKAEQFGGFRRSRRGQSRPASVLRSGGADVVLVIRLSERSFQQAGQVAGDVGVGAGRGCAGRAEFLWPEPSTRRRGAGRYPTTAQSSGGTGAGRLRISGAAPVPSPVPGRRTASSVTWLTMNWLCEDAPAGPSPVRCPNGRREAHPARRTSSEAGIPAHRLARARPTRPRHSR